jgi:hypothetical protein
MKIVSGPALVSCTKSTMSDEVESYEYRGCKVRIMYDPNGSDPMEYEDTSLFLVANHRSFYVPEPGEKRVPNDPAELLKRYKKTHWIFPLEAYIHSGVRLAYSNQGDFPDRCWDVSQLGFVFVSKKEWRLSKKAKAAGQDLIAHWNCHLSGEVYGYITEDPSGAEIDACWGYVGGDQIKEGGFLRQAAEYSIDVWCNDNQPVT